MPKVSRTIRGANVCGKEHKSVRNAQVFYLKWNVCQNTINNRLTNGNANLNRTNSNMRENFFFQFANAFHVLKHANRSLACSLFRSHTHALLLSFFATFMINIANAYNNHKQLLLYVQYKCSCVNECARCATTM